MMKPARMKPVRAHCRNDGAGGNCGAKQKRILPAGGFRLGFNSSLSDLTKTTTTAAVAVAAAAEQQQQRQQLVAVCTTAQFHFWA